jgi:hypothetical protein
MTDAPKPTPWTPGPWIAAAKPSSVVGWPIVASGGRLISDLAWQPKPEHVTAEEYDAFYRECQSNATLIALAPELVEALAELVDQGLTIDGDTILVRCPSHAGAMQRLNKARALLSRCGR